MKDLFRRHPKQFSSPDDAEERSRAIPEDLWVKCPKCHELLYTKELERNLKVCAKCSHHFRLSARERIELLLDEDSFVEDQHEVAPSDPLGFISMDQPYPSKLRDTQRKTGLKEAILSGEGSIESQRLLIAVSDFSFMGASMGQAYGERITRVVEEAIGRRLPVMVVSASGGARMHEGIFSLMQMAKTVAAFAKLAEAGLPFISLLTDPTFGGVTASYATIADVIIAEPGALIGFAGPRVIEQAIRQKLPPGAQTAEFLLEHGMVDLVLPRRELRTQISRLLRFYCPDPTANGRDYSAASALLAPSHSASQNGEHE